MAQTGQRDELDAAAGQDERVAAVPADVDRHDRAKPGRAEQPGRRWRLQEIGQIRLRADLGQQRDPLAGGRVPPVAGPLRIRCGHGQRGQAGANWLLKRVGNGGEPVGQLRRLLPQVIVRCPRVDRLGEQHAPALFEQFHRAAGLAGRDGRGRRVAGHTGELGEQPLLIRAPQAARRVSGIPIAIRSANAFQ